MRQRSQGALLTSLLLTFGFVAEASAQEGTDPATDVALRSWWLDGWIGLGSANIVGHEHTTLCNGVTALRGVGPGLAVGLGADVALPIEDESNAFVGVLGGLVFREPRLTVHVLGEYGAHYVDDIGRSLLLSSDSNFPSATLPYVGARFGLDFHLGGARVFSLGLWGIARADRGHRHVLFSAEDQVSLFGGTTQDEDYEVGGASTALGVRFGVALP